MSKPVPYKGDNGFIFVSYAHRDSQLVWPIVERMQQDGYRVWYDEGIDPGTEWDENIAAHVEGCGYFVAVLSANYFASENCKDELNYSRDLGKPQLLIYLEDVELPRGMAMRMGRNQTAHYDQFENKDDFYAEVYSAKDFTCFQGDNAPPATEEAPTHTRTRMGGSRGWLSALVLVLMAAAFALGFFLIRSRQPEETAPPETTTAPVVTAQETTTALQQLSNVMLLDTDQITLTVLHSSFDNSDYHLHLACKNKTTQELTLRFDALLLNGVNYVKQSKTTLSAQDTAVVELSWQPDDLELYGFTPSDITSVRGLLRVYTGAENEQPEQQEFIFYPQGEENAAPIAYTPQAGDIVLVDDERLHLVATNMNYAFEGSWEFILILHNRTDEQIYLETSYPMINGTQTRDYWGASAYDNSITGTALIFEQEQWDLINSDKVLFLSGTWIMKDSNRTEIARYPFALYPEGEDAALSATYTHIWGENVFTRDDIENMSMDILSMSWRETSYILQNKLCVMYLDTQRMGERVFDRFIVANRTEQPLETGVILFIHGEEPVVQPFTLEPGQPILWSVLRKNPYTPCPEGDEDLVCIGTVDPDAYTAFPYAVFGNKYYIVNQQSFVPNLPEDTSTATP